MEAWDGRENLEVCDVTTADVELDVLDVGLFERRCVELMFHRVSGSHSQQLCGRRAWCFYGELLGWYCVACFVSMCISRLFGLNGL